MDLSWLLLWYGVTLIVVSKVLRSQQCSSFSLVHSTEWDSGRSVVQGASFSPPKYFPAGSFYPLGVRGSPGMIVGTSLSQEKAGVRVLGSARCGRDHVAV